MALIFFRQPKIASQIAEHLRLQIIRGELKDGDLLLTQAQLGAQFGVSRPTLREALRILESESLIRISRGAHGGARIIAPSERMVAHYVARYFDFQEVPVTDVHRALMAIELPAVERLARSVRKEDIDVLTRQLEVENVTDHNWAAAIVAATEFHHIIVDLAGNRTLGIIHRMIEEIIVRAGTQIGLAYQSEADSQIQSYHRVHKQIVDMLSEGVIDEACSLWSRHLRARSTVLERIAASNGRNSSQGPVSE